MSTPLPPNPFAPSAFHTSYQRCLALEAAAPGLQPPSHCPPPIVCARILGHLLRLAPAGNGQGQVEHDIASARDDNELMDVARYYLVYLIQTFKRSNCPTPAPSEHSSYLSSGDSPLDSMAVMQQVTLDLRSARDAAMQRDDNCCMIIGVRDKRHGGNTYLEATHIIPEGTNKEIAEEDTKRFHVANVWILLSIFTDINIPVEFAANQIHRLQNILTLDFYCHRLFDELDLWLKPIEGRQNTYRVCVYSDSLGQRLNLPDTVTFSTTTEHPLPRPALLALHALCCEVAWMSGAADYITDIEERVDQTRVLANDGSSADLLISVLALAETF